MSKFELTISFNVELSQAWFNPVQTCSDTGKRWVNFCCDTNISLSHNFLIHHLEGEILHWLEIDDNGKARVANHYDYSRDSLFDSLEELLGKTLAFVVVDRIEEQTQRFAIQEYNSALV